MNNAENARIAIGKKLRSLRIDAGISQQKLAELAGVAQPIINLLEAGERKITVDYAQKLAPALGITPLDLLPPGFDVSWPGK